MGPAAAIDRPPPRRGMRITAMSSALGQELLPCRNGCAGCSEGGSAMTRAATRHRPMVNAEFLNGVTGPESHRGHGSIFGSVSSAGGRSPSTGRIGR